MLAWRFAETFRYIIVAQQGAAGAILARHQLGWGDIAACAARHQLGWGDWLLQRRHAATWGLSVAFRHISGYGEMVAVQHSSKWSIALAKSLSLSYSQPTLNARRTETPWSLTAPNAARNSVAFSMLTGSPAVCRNEARWDVRNDTAQIVPSGISLVYGTASLRVIEASLSIDEGSPLWIAGLTLERVEDFALLPVGGLVTLAVCGETFNLIVDSKQLARNAPASAAFRVSLSSPLALKDSPFSATIEKTWDTPTSAKAAVEEMLGPVDWRLLDWVLPAGSATYANTTPLNIARSIVSAVGGIVESEPGGTVVCRPRHYYSPPTYQGSPIGLSLTDADLLESVERQSVVQVTNRLTVSNELSGASGSDRIEFVADEADDNAGVVRIYPEPWRGMELVHTGDTTVSISDDGEVVRTEEQIIDVIAGVGNTTYPIHEVVDFEWRYSNLGGITPAGNGVRSAVAGYSLLWIKYRTRSRNFAVANSKDEDVLFLAMEA